MFQVQFYYFDWFEKFQRTFRPFCHSLQKFDNFVNTTNILIMPMQKNCSKAQCFFRFIINLVDYLFGRSVKKIFIHLDASATIFNI